MGSDSIHRGIDASFIRASVRDAVAAIADEAKTLEGTGRAASDALTDLFVDADAEELSERAARLHGVVLHATNVAAALAVRAGELRGLAAARRAIDLAM